VFYLTCFHPCVLTRLVRVYPALGYAPMSPRYTLSRFPFVFCHHYMTCPSFLLHFPGYLSFGVSYFSSCGIPLTICFVRYYINLSNRRNHTLQPSQPLFNPNQPLKSTPVSPQSLNLSIILSISQSFYQESDNDDDGRGQLGPWMPDSGTFPIHTNLSNPNQTLPNLSIILSISKPVNHSLTVSHLTMMVEGDNWDVCFRYLTDHHVSSTLSHLLSTNPVSISSKQDRE
jgi:hypothetical protein